jgi:O-antigen/teichoic acid export membrane protein
MELRQKRAELADWLTNALKLDVRFYGRSFSWLSLGHVSGVIRGIATTFLMARWLAPETLGQFRYVIAFFGIAGIFSLTGMNASVIRGVAKGDTVVARAALRRILQFAPIGSILLAVAAFERYVNAESSVALALFIAAIAFTPYSISGLYGPILTGLEKIKELSHIAIVNNLLYAIVFVVVLMNDRGLLVITLAYFGFDILFRGFLTLREFRRLPQKGSVEGHMSLGHHMSGIGVMQSIAMYINQILLQRFWGYSTLASFSVATVIPEQTINAVKSLSGIFLQRLSRHKKTEGHVRATRRHFWIALGGSALIVAGYAAIAPFVIPWLFPQYPDATLPSIVYAIGFLSIPTIVGIYFLQAHNMIKRLWYYYVSNTVLQLTTSVVLTPIFGEWGAIWSRVVTRLGSLPLSYPGAAGIEKKYEEEPFKR